MSKGIPTIPAMNVLTNLYSGAKAKARPGNSTRGSILMAGMKNRHQPRWMPHDCPRQFNCNTTSKQQRDVIAA